MNPWKPPRSISDAQFEKLEQMEAAGTLPRGGPLAAQLHQERTRRRLHAEQQQRQQRQAKIDAQRQAPRDPGQR